MEEMDKQKVVELLEEILSSGLAIKPVNRIRVKIEKFIPFWEHMKDEETATYFAEVILRRLKEIDNELESLPGRQATTADKVMQPSFNPSPAKQQRFILQGPVVNQTDRASRGHYTKANFIRLLNKPLISLANLSTTLEYHLLRLRQTLLNTFFVLSIFHRVDCSDASLYSAIANMTLARPTEDGLGGGTVTLLQVLGNYVIGQALARESVAPKIRDYKDILRCPYMYQDVGGHLSKDMLDNCIRLFIEHMPKFGQVSGYHHMNFGYGMYLAYMQIRDACCVTSEETSPFAMVSEILANQDNELADQSLCCLFMLMKELLGLVVVPPDVLTKTVKNLLPYRIWPLPVGTLVSSLISAITKELKFPGYHVRQGLSRLVSHILQSKSDNRNVQMCRVFLNTDSYQGGMFNETLQRYVKYREAVLRTFGKDELVFTCFRLSLLSALSSSGTLDFDTGIKILRGGIENEFVSLPEIQRELAKIEETACEFQTMEKAQAYRSEATKKMLEEISKTLNPENEKTVPELDLVPDFGPSFTIHEISDLRNSNYIEVLEGTSGASGPKEKRYPNSDAGIQLHKILLELSANSPSKSRFQGFGTTRTLQIAIAGGDGTIHNFLKGYVNVHANYHDLIQKCGIEFKIYILPLGVTNRLASYIAYYDSWFCGTVFTSLGNDLPLVPLAEMFTQILTTSKEDKNAVNIIQHRMTMVLNKLKDLNPLEGSFGGHSSSARNGKHKKGGKGQGEDEESNTDTLKGIKADSIPSANICGHVLEKYMDVAHEKLAVSIFVCEAWALQGKKNMHYTIPFCTQAYVGLPVHLAGYGDKNIFQQLISGAEQILHDQQGRGGTPDL